MEPQYSILTIVSLAGVSYLLFFLASIPDKKQRKIEKMYNENTCPNCLKKDTWFFYRNTGKSRHPEVIGSRKEKTIFAPRSDGSYEMKQEVTYGASSIDTKRIETRYNIACNICKKDISSNEYYAVWVTDRMKEHYGVGSIFQNNTKREKGIGNIIRRW